MSETVTTPANRHPLDEIVRYRRGQGDAQDTPVTLERALLDACSIAVTLDDVARIAGTTPDSLRRFLRDAAEVDRSRAAGSPPGATGSRLVSFRDQLERRMGETRARIIGGIQRIGLGGYDRSRVVVTEKPGENGTTLREVRTESETADGEWRALAWLAERTYAETFATRRSIEVSGPGGGPIQVESPRERLLGQLEDLRRRAITVPEVPTSNGDGGEQAAPDPGDVHP